MSTVDGILLAAGGGSAGTFVGAIVAAWVVCLGLLAWRRVAGVAAAALFGFGVSIYLGIQHHVAAGASACTVSAIFDCDTVNRSEYSELAGIPIAFLGSGFYAAVFVLAMGVLTSDRYKNATVFAFWAGLVSVAYSVFLAWASSQLGTWCLMCISLYGFNLILTAGAWAANKETGVSFSTLGAHPKDQSLKMALGVGLVVLLGTVGWYRSAHETVETGDVTTSLAQLFHAPEGVLELDGTEAVLGAADAPYTVVEFADFQCPYCGKIAPDLAKLVADLPQIKLLFKHYPISNICNDKVGRVGHENACGAAMAAECAGKQGRFWEMDKLMFMNQDYLAADNLRFMAQQIGLDLPAFEVCMADPATEAAVRADVAHAEKAGVHGTPALFLGGITDGFVQVEGGPEGIALLVRAHQEGQEIPPTRPAPQHNH